MSFIVDVSVPEGEFALGKILEARDHSQVVLESIVPTDGQAVPLFRLQDSDSERFQRSVRRHPAVTAVEAIETNECETLYALTWDSRQDAFIEGIRAVGATIHTATAEAETWQFTLQFPSRDELTEFREYCTDVGIQYTIERLINLATLGTGQWYRLTPPQQEALRRAVEAGYYAIPRQTSTEELAEELGISDQAVTERLRRAIVTLVVALCPQIDQDG